MRERCSTVNQRTNARPLLAGQWLLDQNTVRAALKPVLRSARRVRVHARRRDDDEDATILV